jgi:protein-S-isoprenylcysteine O-methyltransferase Ste14
VSYMLAFAAQLVAFPSLVTLGLFVLNVGLFTHAAITDERSLARSDLAEEYARYKASTGMFLPLLWRR